MPLFSGKRNETAKREAEMPLFLKVIIWYHEQSSHRVIIRVMSILGPAFRPSSNKNWHSEEFLTSNSTWTIGCLEVFDVLWWI